jgi:hypothetical protein
MSSRGFGRSPLLLAIVLVLGVVACGDGTAEPEALAPGMYIMERWDGDPLPAKRSSTVWTGWELEVLSGSMRLDAGGSLLYTLNTVLSGAPMMQELPGTYTATGGHITFRFRYDDGTVEAMRGVWHGDALTLIYDNSTGELHALFRRRR